MKYLWHFSFFNLSLRFSYIFCIEDKGLGTHFVRHIFSAFPKRLWILICFSKMSFPPERMKMKSFSLTSVFLGKFSKSFKLCPLTVLSSILIPFPLVNFNRKGTILLALDPPKMMTLHGVVRVVISFRVLQHFTNLEYSLRYNINFITPEYRFYTYSFFNFLIF